MKVAPKLTGLGGQFKMFEKPLETPPEIMEELEEKEKKEEEYDEPEPEGIIIPSSMKHDDDVVLTIKTDALHPWFVPWKQSVQIVKSVNDLCRSFKCGWSSNVLIRPFIDMQEGIVGTPFKVDMVKMVDDNSMSAFGTECLLDIALEFTDFTNGERLMHFKPREDNRLLHSYADNLQNVLPDIKDDNVLKLASSVWKLGVALWSDLNNDMRTNYEIQMLRKDYVTEWLQQFAVDCLGECSSEKKIFSELTARRLQNACNLAIKCGNLKMALILAQACSNEKVKQLVRTQLACWQRTEADLFIDEDYLKIYATLAGCMVWSGNGGTINVCENLDWKRCLAMHLWFYCKSTDTIKNGLEAYEDAYQGKTANGTYCAPPVPDYCSKDTSVPTRDIRFQLLQLFCDKASVKLSDILSTNSYTNNPLDVRLAWHLWHALHSLEYRHLDEMFVERLHLSYASLLEGLGLYHWSIFVLSHVENEKRRESYIKEVLLRHGTLGKGEDNWTSEEEFILKRLYLPERYLHESKAIRARVIGDVDAECLHLLKSESYTLCEKILVEKVAPKSLFLQRKPKVDYVRSLLEKLEKAVQDGGKICGWTKSGKVLYDYVNVNTTLELLANCEKMDTCSLDLLNNDLNSLLARIDSMPVPDTTMAFVQDEMRKRTRNISRVLEMLERQEDGSYRLPEVSSR